jgi:NitT/TauT family transport system permease protein
MAEAVSKTPEAGAPQRAPADRPRKKRRRRLVGIFDPLEPRTYMIIAILSFALLFFGWWVAAEIDLAKDIFLPGPVDVWNRAVELIEDGTLWDDTKVSFVRITIGFLISTAIALPIGILIGTYRSAEAAIEPPVDFIRYMPAVAFLPLTIVWVGVDESQKWLIIFIGTFFQQVLLVMDNVKSVPRDFVNLGRTLEMSETKILFRIVLPSAMPAIWDSMRISLGWAWTWLVVAELVAATSGLGYRITTAQRFFQTDTIFGYLLLLGVLGLTTDQAMKLAHRRLFRYLRAR